MEELKLLVKFALMPNLIEYLNMNLMTSTNLLMNSDKIVDFFLTTDLNEYVNVYTLLLGSCIFVIYNYRYIMQSYFYNFLQNYGFKFGKDVSCYVYDQDNVLTLSSYFYYYHDVFSHDVTLQLGDKEYFLDAKLAEATKENKVYDPHNKSIFDYLPYENVENNFVIKDLNIEGSLIFKYEHKERSRYDNAGQKSVIDVSLPYIIIKMKTNNNNKIKEFLTYAKQQVADIKKNRFVQYSIFCYKNGNDIENEVKKIYDDKKFDAKKQKKLYIDSFFHPKRDILWKAVHRVHFEPEYYYKFGQAGKHCILAHGPPGTGKSTYAYRIAMATGRHIVNLNLSDIESRGLFYQILRNPNVAGRNEPTKDVIFILDEFDDAIKKLYNETKMENDMNELIIKKIKESKDSTENISMEVLLKQLQPQKTSTNDDEMSSGSKKKVNANNLKVNKSLTMNDLLNVIQGSVPLDGLIMVATTNNYEEIKDICPALFRPGRFTPVLFDYPTKSLIDQMTNFYYNKTISDILELPEQIKMPISWFTDKMSTYDDFDFFVEELKSQLSMIK